MLDKSHGKRQLHAAASFTVAPCSWAPTSAVPRGMALQPTSGTQLQKRDSEAFQRRDITRLSSLCHLPHSAPQINHCHLREEPLSVCRTKSNFQFKKRKGFHYEIMKKTNKGPCFRVPKENPSSKGVGGGGTGVN